MSSVIGASPSFKRVVEATVGAKFTSQAPPTRKQYEKYARHHQIL
jgi:hypothetical protein